METRPPCHRLEGAFSLPLPGESRVHRPEPLSLERCAGLAVGVKALNNVLELSEEGAAQEGPLRPAAAGSRPARR